MPLPLIAIPIIKGLAVAAGATGLYKGGKAVMDNMEASDINEKAKNIVQIAEEELEQNQENTNNALKNLGTTKIEILQNEVQDFLKTFGRIKNVEFAHDGLFDGQNIKDFNLFIGDLKKEVNFITDLSAGLVGGVTSGALTAFGAYSGTMALGSASTGTAISVLSGVAAKNATLAWLGGGALKAGGLGMAGGATVLTAVAAGPAVLVAGWYMGSKAEASLENAKGNIAEAKKFASDVENAIVEIQGIASLAKSLNELLNQLKDYAVRNIKILQNVINSEGLDYRQYKDEAKLCVAKNFKLMQVIKAVLDVAILDEEGNVLSDANSNLQNIRSNLVNHRQDYIIE